jgi:hypothetical protein
MTSMQTSAVTEIMARALCCRIRSSRVPFSSDALSGKELNSIQDGLALALERGWLARAGAGYVLTIHGHALARRARAGSWLRQAR